MLLGHSARTANGSEACYLSTESRFSFIDWVKLYLKTKALRKQVDWPRAVGALLKEVVSTLTAYNLHPVLPGFVQLLVPRKYRSQNSRI
jgi:hypothetical protein